MTKLKKKRSRNNPNIKARQTSLIIYFFHSYGLTLYNCKALILSLMQGEIRLKKEMTYKIVVITLNALMKEKYFLVNLDTLILKIWSCVPKNVNSTGFPELVRYTYSTSVFGTSYCAFDTQTIVWPIRLTAFLNNYCYFKIIWTLFRCVFLISKKQRMR